MTFASQGVDTELALATLAVKQEKELMDAVSMHREKLKDCRAEEASNEKSQNFVQRVSRECERCSRKHYTQSVNQHSIEH